MKVEGQFLISHMQHSYKQRTQFLGNDRQRDFNYQYWADLHPTEPNFFLLSFC